MQAPVGSVADMTASGDSLWVALYGDPVVKRVGTDGKLEATIHLTRTPVALAAGNGTVAIAVTRSSR
jgi:hypothetical protein